MGRLSSAFEEHVLREVRDPVRLRRLVARARRQHDEARHRLGMRHRRGQDRSPFCSSKRSKTPTRPCYRGVRGRREDAGGSGGTAGVARRSAGRQAASGQGAWPPSAAARPSTPPRPPAAAGAQQVLLDRRADVLVVSHEGGTPLTLEAANVFAGPKWLVTGGATARLPRSATRWSWPRPSSSRATATPRPTPVRRGVGGIARRGRLGAQRGRRRARRRALCRSLSTGVSWSPAPAATGRPPRRRSAKLREGVHVAAEAHLLEAAARPSGGGRRRHPLLRARRRGTCGGAGGRDGCGPAGARV